MLPHIILHNAQSLDGRMDWFTPDIGLYYEVAAGFSEEATLVGCQTILRSLKMIMCGLGTKSNQNKITK